MNPLAKKYEDAGEAPKSSANVFNFEASLPAKSALIDFAAGAGGNYLSKRKKKFFHVPHRTVLA